MWYEGKIVEWNDDRGFGFVRSPLLDERVFFHIKDFTRRGRRSAIPSSCRRARMTEGEVGR